MQQSDDVVWGIINKSFCSFKISTSSQKFCRNEYNLTGLCSRTSCPLANSQYATVREEKGIIYLYMRTAERLPFPAKQWEKVKLSRSLVLAQQQIDENLVFWKAYFRQKCRARLLKITQYLTRMRRMKYNRTKKVIVPVRRKLEVRLRRREDKALVAARLDNVIEKELLERLKKGTYERIYNFPQEAFNVKVDQEEVESDVDEVELGEEDKEEEVETDEDVEGELEREVVNEENAADDEDDDEDDDDDDADMDDDDAEAGIRKFVADFDESEDEDIDIEDAADQFTDSDSDVSEEEIETKPLKKIGPKLVQRRGRAQLEIEYEEPEAADHIKLTS